MASSKRLGLLLVICLGILAPALAFADCDVKPGTVITKQNWTQYKDCFSYGEQRLWQGDLFWKMPEDVEIHVGKQHQWTLPKPYVEATEKYGGQTRLVKQPGGLYKLENYVAGLPFPNPSEPDKGTKIAANVTYKMQGYQWGMFQDLGAGPVLYTKDRFGNSAPSILDFTYFQTAYNWESDQGVPAVNPQANGAWYNQWIMQLTPEQSKYTTVLTIFYQDNLRFEDDYVFVPSLRRSLRLSASARCAPLFGSDAIKDDQRYGWNGGVGMFTGKWLRDMKLLTLVTMDTKAPAVYPDNYDGFLGWAKPSWGDWETRDVYVDDIRRSPEFNTGYCYGSRVDYIDKQYYTSLAEDIYDAQMQLWKVFVFSTSTKNLDNYGEQMWMGGIAYDVWDVQNDHVTLATTANPKGLTIFWDKDFPERYRDLTKYGTPNGLSMVMR
jgi:Protein of unknown function (DUF1329)